MNREIKFRFWDVNNNEYWQPTYKAYDGEINDMTISKCGQIFVRDTTPHPTALPLDQEDFVIEQYTGLKDKNGVEIYEGDIYKYYDFVETNEMGDDVFKEDIRVVEYKEGVLSIGFSFLSHHSNIEVIGNINENKELLQ